VERVLSRLDAIATALPQAKPEIGRVAAALAAQPDAQARPSDTAQALFDLGATICTPAAPVCALCPWRPDCAAQALGIQASLPRKAPKPVRPLRHGAAFYLADADGLVLLRRRPPRGLLGGMSELPGTAWRAEPWQTAEALPLAPLSADWRPAGQVRHVFTHFELRLDVYAAPLSASPPPWPLTRPEQAALPSLMRKCIALGRALWREDHRPD
jgi:A/G-specific adenine glycosylase